MSKTITLTPEQEAFFALRVAKGDFHSIEDAAPKFLNEAIFGSDFDDDDLE